jgi:hypothetical protein
MYRSVSVMLSEHSNDWARTSAAISIAYCATKYLRMRGEVVVGAFASWCGRRALLFSNRRAAILTALLCLYYRDFWIFNMLVQLGHYSTKNEMSKVTRLPKILSLHLCMKHVYIGVGY